jgi:hypothetical protein
MVIFFIVVVFVFLFFLVWLLSKEDIGSYRPIRRVRTGAFWMYSAHARWYASCPWQTQASPNGNVASGNNHGGSSADIMLDVHKKTLSCVEDASG